MKRIVIVQRIEIRKTKKGENFATLAVNLGLPGDFATMEAKIWQADRLTQPGGQGLPAVHDIIECAYTESEYNGARQWVIENFRRLAGEELARAKQAFVQPTRIDRAYYMRRLEDLIDATDPARLSGMALREVFDSGSFREDFYKAPAAKTRHQNYPGGLLEHTINVTSLALALADAYIGAPDEPGLSFNSERLPVDRSLLIAAGLLHDIGKLDTYRFAPLPETTDTNNFEGHLPISYAIVREIVMPMKQTPPHAGAEDEADKLLNCILSHHGTLEFGSPVVPCCVEAVFLSQADIADARFSEIATAGWQALRLAPDARWIRPYHFPGGMFIGDWGARAAAPAAKPEPAAALPGRD